jgi:hypothetical protein
MLLDALENLLCGVGMFFKKPLNVVLVRVKFAPDFDSKNLQLPDIIAQVCPTS